MNIYLYFRRIKSGRLLIVSVLSLFAICLYFSKVFSICRSVTNGVYYMCARLPLYDGILKDPRDLDPCPKCCRAALKGIVFTIVGN